MCKSVLDLCCCEQLLQALQQEPVLPRVVAQGNLQITSEWLSKPKVIAL